MASIRTSAFEVRYDSTDSRHRRRKWKGVVVQLQRTRCTKATVISVSRVIAAWSSTNMYDLDLTRHFESLDLGELLAVPKSDTAWSYLIAEKFSTTECSLGPVLIIGRIFSSTVTIVVHHVCIPAMALAIVA